ncbi:MAG: glycerol-3-phosphate dehydrogenase/oxidase [Deltaproteobacteria bacterium]|nr:MAG: glycerol-3-phosphate dehydrogenase/oxidase [Deltaproteobacteria bacterium]
MAGFEPTTRRRNLERLAAESFDLLVIGGGITGAGVAREAALRGLTVGLVDARDFAAGTSSRSSKLIHGGLRYLEQGEIALVREAATERKVLRRIAPHLTETAPMFVPVYGRTSAGVYKLRVGLALFDKLAAVAADERHRILSRQEALAAEPCLNAERLQGAAVYPEYVTDDARLVLDTLKSAHHAGAAVVNHAPVVAIGGDARARRIEIRDAESGAPITVQARVVVNAAGPWVDVVQRMDADAPGPVLHLTKGIHLVFRAEDLPVRHCVVMRARDGRPLFTVPRGTWVYVGTTDTSYAGPLEEPEVTAEDAEYLFETLARSFPDLRLAPEHVVGAWAGVRPLIQEEGRSPSEISRKDEIAVSASGLVTIAGGKLTTYRRMAERVVDAALPLLGRTSSAGRSGTELLAGGEPLDSAGHAPETGGESTLPGDTWARLRTVHGSDAVEVRALADDAAAWAPFAPDVPLSPAEVRHAVRREMACTLADVLERRSRIALFATERACAIAADVAVIVAAELGWSAERRDREVAAFRRQCDARLGWRASAPTGVAASGGYA